MNIDKLVEELISSYNFANVEDKQEWRNILNLSTVIIESGKKSGQKLARSFNYRSIAHRVLGDMEKAIEDIDKAIEINPECGDFFKEKGLCLYSRKEYNNSADNLRKSVKLDDKHYQNILYLAGVLNGLGNFGEGKIFLEKAEKLKPQKGELIHIYYGDYYLLKGEFRKAIVYFKTALNTKKFSVAYSNISYCLNCLSNYSEALETIKKSLEMGEDTGNLTNHASIMNNLGKHDLGLESASKAISMDRTNIPALVVRGNSYRLSGDDASAKNQYTSVLDIFLRIPKEDWTVCDCRSTIMAERSLDEIPKTTVEETILKQGNFFKGLFDTHLEYIK